MKKERSLNWQLDKVLHYLANSGNNSFKIDLLEYFKSLNISSIDTVAMLDKLVEEKLVKSALIDRYIETKEGDKVYLTIGNPRVDDNYRITWEGKFFLAQGGFTHKYRKEKNKIRLVNSERLFLLVVALIGAIFTSVEIYKFFFPK